LDTHKKTKETRRFIILVPHRDSLKPLEEYRRRLFAAGFCGAYSFPAAAPLVMVSRSFSREELKELARSIRERTGETDGKIESTSSCGWCGSWLNQLKISSTQEYLSFFGPCLDFPLDESLFPQTAKDKILYIPPSPVLCAALADSGLLPAEANRSGESPVFEETPVLSFRAAYLANLAIRPLAGGDPDYSFEWRIGPPVWLPKYKG